MYVYVKRLWDAELNRVIIIFDSLQNWMYRYNRNFFFFLLIYATYVLYRFIRFLSPRNKRYTFQKIKWSKLLATIVIKYELIILAVV